ncbi:MAG TPA: glycosyltransferase family 4 protein [Burkholderiales bacterium]|nr:glycosyltransferase family 4 protein [Burkholderiales bacterium]
MNGPAVSRVVFVNRYFYPDLSATSQILTDLAFRLAAEGDEVIVLTGRQTYTDPKASLAPRERVSGVEVVRVRTTGFGRNRLLGRAIDYASFYVAALVKLLLVLRKGDVLVAKTDPPLMSVVAAFAAWLRGAKQVNWLQDLFPEVAVVLRPDLVNGSLARAAKAARDWSLRRARANVVLGTRMWDRVRLLGIPRAAIAMIPNWTDDRTILPVAHADNPLRREWGLDGKFVVSYSGNLGRAHEFRTILDAAYLLRDREDIVFLMIGGGAQLDHVREFVQDYGLTNVVERPYQPRERLPLSLGAGDLHLVSLVPGLEGCIVPSKFYGIAAAQRPTAFIGDHLLGEIGRLLHRFDCGRSFAVGDAAGLAGFIAELAQDRDRWERMGRNARRALDAEWSQEKAFERWRAVLTACATGARLQTEVGETAGVAYNPQLVADHEHRVEA